MLDRSVHFFVYSSLTLKSRFDDKLLIWILIIFNLGKIHGSQNCVRKLLTLKSGHERIIGEIINNYTMLEKHCHMQYVLCLMMIHTSSPVLTSA